MSAYSLPPDTLPPGLHKGLTWNCHACPKSEACLGVPGGSGNSKQVILSVLFMLPGDAWAEKGRKKKRKVSWEGLLSVVGDSSV